MCCVNGAEFASFAVFSWGSLDSLLDCWPWVRIQQISRNSLELWANRAKSEICSSLEFSVDGQKSESSELDVDEF